MQKLTFTFLLGFFSTLLFAQDSIKVVQIDEVQVSGVRADDLAPTTFKTIKTEELEVEDLGTDLPVLLDKTPSYVSTSDAGAGVGYTFMRIRGSDQSRINVTINDIPLNDAESQGVFWVNTADIVSSVKDIQIQRGLGTSTNGAGAFGATVSLNTVDFQRKPYAEIEASAGSFKTFKQSLKLGTGLIKDRFAFNGRVSHITSNGYIDRASSNLWSYYLSGSYYDENTTMHFIHFSGKEKTYQAWNGIDSATMATNRTFNSAGTDWGQLDPPYDNETDNYKQDHYQFLFTQRSKKLKVNFGLHATKGKGYFEQYKVESDLASYNLDYVVNGSDTIKTTDLIRRRWLDNIFYGITHSTQYTHSKKFNLTIGGAWNQYDGDHFGEIIWAQFASNGNYKHRFYDNNGLKTDFNVYAKTNVLIKEKLNWFLDLQYRNVGYSVAGLDIDNTYIFNDVDHNFFNPKTGFTYLINNNSNAYISVGLGNREPTRNDFIDAPAGTTPTSEKLYDVELGYRLQKEKYNLHANGFLMYYKDQLVLTGALNDVGTPIRQNVDKSYRTGIELDAAYAPFEKLEITGNISYALHQIKEYNETTPSGTFILFENTKLAYSPSFIGAATIDYKPVTGLSIALSGKGVSRQYLDNTSNKRLSLDPYFLNDLRLSYSVQKEHIKEVGFTFLIKNLTNRKYISNGYVYYGEPYFYPQAGIHFLAGVRMRF